MNVIALQSGSNGNCIYVESDGVRLLFDAGISGKQAQACLAAHGRNIEDVHALIISHDHRDYSRCLSVYQRKFRLPVHITRGTLTVASKKDNLGSLSDVRHFIAGSALRFSEPRNCGCRSSHFSKMASMFGLISFPPAVSLPWRNGMITIRPLVIVSSLGDDGSSAPATTHSLAPPARILCGLRAAALSQGQESRPRLRSVSGGLLKCPIHSPR